MKTSNKRYLARRTKAYENPPKRYRRMKCIKSSGTKLEAAMEKILKDAGMHTAQSPSTSFML